MLTFRSVQIDLDLKSNSSAYFVYVFVVSWIVGIGRYWDHPNAYAWQYAGLGSIAYVVVLSSILWAIIKPLHPARWSFKMVLIFVGMTSLPAVLYAIPVERFMPLKQAQTVNAWFLAIVATWRVALYLRFLASGAQLQGISMFVATVLPLSGIIVALAILNLEHVVFSIMAGIGPEDMSPNDDAYGLVVLLSLFAWIAFPVSLISYMVVASRKARQ